MKLVSARLSLAAAAPEPDGDSAVIGEPPTAVIAGSAASAGEDAAAVAASAIGAPP